MRITLAHPAVLATGSYRPRCRLPVTQLDSPPTGEAVLDSISRSMVPRVDRDGIWSLNFQGYRKEGEKARISSLKL
jgi:hypothetical protein